MPLKAALDIKSEGWERNKVSKERGRKSLLRLWTSHVNTLLWEYDIFKKLKAEWGMGKVSYTTWSLEGKMQSMQGVGLSPKILVSH